MTDTSIVNLVYTGWATLGGDDPKGAVLQIVNQDGTLGRELFFARKAMKTSLIGAVYEVMQTSETTFVLSARRYVGMFHDTDQVAAWQIANKAEIIKLDAMKAEKGAKDIPAAFEALAPLRKIYRTALPDRRRAIEVLLLDYLRRV